MIEYFEQLEAEERQSISDTIRLLWKQTFLLERKFDKKLGRMRFSRHYRVCYKHFAFLKEYFEIGGVELVENSQTGVIYIRGEQVMAEKLSKLTTIYLLVLKLLYDEQMATASSSEQIYVSLSELNERVGNYGLMRVRPTLTEIKRSISLLKRYQLIDIMTAVDDIDADSKMLIYPSINLVLYGEDAQAYLDELDSEDRAEEVDSGEEMRIDI